MAYVKSGWLLRQIAILEPFGKISFEGNVIVHQWHIFHYVQMLALDWVVGMGVSPKCWEDWYCSGTILKRWKNNWFDLWSNGQLLYYDDQLREDMEDKIHMKVDCINIRSGNECRDIHPPEGKPRDCLLQILCRDERTINLCAESADDCLAWKLALQEAHINLNSGPEMLLDEAGYTSAPPPYTAYPTAPAQVYSYDSYSNAYAAQPHSASQQVIYTSNGQPYAVAYQYPYQGPYPPTANHVIIQDRRRDDGDLALGMVAGAATGMALGSLFWAF